MNRDAVLSQLEGGAIFGYNMSMNENLTIKDGQIVEGNFSDYPIARTGDVPKINIHFGALSGHDRFSEAGEPPVGVVGPAIGNAIFKASAMRLRAMPFRLSGQLNWV
jgi:isoquinoline 1-oxidoreductase beta subunit